MGRCLNGIFVCPICGRIHGGLAVGNHFKDCEFCALSKQCDIRIRHERVPEYERICPSCLVYVVQKMTGGSHA